MKRPVLIGIVFALCSLSLLEAGSLVTIADRPEITGKLTLTASAVHAEGSSSSDINFADILEADFTDIPFQLNFFLSRDDKGGQLPPGWTGQDIGTVLVPGSTEDTAGTFTVKGAGNEPRKGKVKDDDALYFAGCPWPGNGEWTVRLVKIGTAAWETGAGLMLRDTLDPKSIMFAMGAGTSGNGGFSFRPEAGKPGQGSQVPMDFPIWLRLTRYNSLVLGSISTDGNQWDVIGQGGVKAMPNPIVGLFVDSRRDKDLGKASFDNLAFTPVPSLSQVLPPGVLLQSGSFIAGSFEHLSTDPANPDVEGVFRRGLTTIRIPRSKIAAVLLLPTTRSQIADMSSHSGLLMKNGDVMDGDFDSIQNGNVQINSVLLGISTYTRTEVRGCFLHPVQVMPAPYQIRLRDGSIVNFTGIGASNDNLGIQDASGVNLSVSADEVAQFRAGPSVAQSLAELAWKATPPPVLPTPAAAASPTPAAPSSTHSEPGPSMAPDAAAAAQAVVPVPPVQTWQGPNQEQILEATLGTKIDFPLPGKFRALGLRVALSADSPPNSQITIRILADGREVGRTPPFKAGDQPRFMEIAIQDPKTVTLEADSIYTGPKVLFIDPVGIRDN